MKERSVLLQGRENGQPTMDFPITRLSDIDGSAEIKETPGEEDYIPIIDGADGQMRKMPFSSLQAQMSQAIREAVAGTIEEAY